MVKTGFLYCIGLGAVLFFMGCTSALKVSAPVTPDLKKNPYIAQGETSGKYWPTNGWKTCAPEAVGMDSFNLAQAMEYAATPIFKTQGILVIKNGYIISEAYFPEANYGHFDKNTEHVSHSMAKSFSSALVGIAIDKGLLSGVDEKICQYYENWDCNDAYDLRSRITLRHAMTLTTGLEWNEDWSKWDFETNDTLKMIMGDRFYHYISQRPGRHEPGQKFYYSTGDPMLLTKVLQEACGMTVFKFAQKNLFAPLNITDIRWDMDADGYTSTAGGLYTSVRSFAKFGFLFLNKGRWEDQQIVSEQWVEKSTQTDPSVNMWDAYGYLWHVNLPLRLAGKQSAVPPDAIPADGYMAEGVLGQNIIIIPSKDLMIVKVANQGKNRIDLAKLITLVIEAEKK